MAEKVETNWQFNPIDANTQHPGQDFQPNNYEAVKWTASEYIAHEKDASWTIGLVLITSIVAVVVYFVTKDRSTPFVVFSLGLLMGITAFKRPRSLNYTIDHEGLQVGAKFYPFEDFRGFSEGPAGALPSLTLIPSKRFMVPLSIYFEVKDSEKIVNIIGSYLPIERRTNDAVDRFMNKIRF